MSSYGIRISAEGIDVKTGADNDMVLTSKYSMLKGSLPGTGVISVPRTGVDAVVTIPHGLGYIPFVQAFWNDRDGDLGDPTQFYPLPFFLATTLVQAHTVDSDTTNVYLRFNIDDFGALGAAVDIRYSYYIFIDKGNLH